MKFWSFVVVVKITILCFVGYWVYQSYGDVIPVIPDLKEYENITMRAESAKSFAHRHNLSEDYCLFVDYCIPSGTPRLFVWPFAENKIVASTYVMHGPGMGSTAEHPVFSNRVGSKCSSVGRFEITRLHGTRNKSGYKLKGFDFSNKMALPRGIMIHSAKWVDMNCWRKYIPLNEQCCQGCFTVSSRGQAYISRLIEEQDKNMLLWAYSSKDVSNESLSAKRKKMVHHGKSVEITLNDM